MLALQASKRISIWPTNNMRSVSLFSTCTWSSITILYILKSQQQSRPYIASELPSNLLLKKIGPNVLIPTLLILWSIIVTLQGQQLGGVCILWSDVDCIHFLFTLGLVTSYAGLATVRAFLGLVEGPMFPGIVLYLSGFYTRKELSLRYVSHLWSLFWRWSLNRSSRIALFFSAASVRYEISSRISLALKFTFSSRALFLGCLLLRSWTWMALVESQDGPGSSFSYVFRIILEFLCNRRPLP